LPWTKNIWQSVSVENYKYISRIDDLSKKNAHTKFISAFLDMIKDSKSRKKSAY